MKYVRSTTNKAYIFDGREIPSIDQAGQWLALPDETFERWKKNNKVVNSLIRAGALAVTSDIPTRAATDVAAQASAIVNAENEKLREQLAAAQASLDDVNRKHQELLDELAKQNIAIEE